MFLLDKKRHDKNIYSYLAIFTLSPPLVLRDCNNIQYMSITDFKLLVLNKQDNRK
ncbi:hypothetical protein MATR_26890 [Marivirga tractuosa]|uniref:Uncharacterized protein n=1 Tax=Marivirga tractuosa (strain ATCC 23168 / DSM 4126 / NBRC 15989 / NCIMB 1408 / VKM B-1430 / H-43) TaxID=643867 RepID=E4TN71_MARTH|nr:hypothetical protein Ftrac_3487 [Marivirga tractuosa DSM 4126]BDD15864.1 hypothetical protein MATR_26890 [Marivirga tractuosa]